MSILKALVVDDERGTRELIERVLYKLNIVPYCASDVERAMHILEDNRGIDLVISDYQMPQKNGREFVEMLKSDPKFDSLPVIMVSGVISLKEISDLMGQGIEFFIPKPLNMKELAHYISLTKERFMCNSSTTSQIQQAELLC